MAMVSVLGRACSSAAAGGFCPPKRTEADPAARDGKSCQNDHGDHETRHGCTSQEVRSLRVGRVEKDKDHLQDSRRSVKV